ncbi:MAG: rod shape-determining protein MreC [Alphaproteobacteria bacterium]|nr:rod shape-determining protein MreC [Alphaproteobacteria bacterium]
MENKFFRWQRFKGQLKKFVPIPFLLGGLVLFVFTALNTPLIMHLKEHTISAVAPLIAGVSAPLNYFRQVGENMSDYWHVYEENKRLKAENEILRDWRTLAIKLSFEHQELSKLLNYQQVAEGREYVVQILSDYNSPFSQSLILNGGRNIGVQKGDVLVSNNGLIGFVQSVGSKTARALKVTDYYARLPVYIGVNRYPAIMSGDNSAFPKLNSLPEEARLSDGDFVMTAGTVGVYPAGIPIGTVKTDVNGELWVDLFEKVHNLEFVRVIDFGLEGLLPDTCQGASEQ